MKLPRSDSPVWRIVALWLLLRVLTSGVALIPSVLPLYRDTTGLEYTSAERTIPVWPPSMPLTAWAERITVEPWFRWDAKYFVWIVSRGVRIQDGTSAFHPLLPLLAKPFYYISGSALGSILTIASLATLCLYGAFHRLARLDLSNDLAWKATLILALYPSSYVFFAPYTESLFLLFAVLLFYFAGRKRWVAASLCGAAATLARQQGLFLLIPLAWELWQAKPSKRVAAFSLLSIPVTFGLLFVYRTFALMDSTPNLSSLQEIIYSVFISPAAREVVDEQRFLLPPHAFWLLILKLWRAPNVSAVTDLILCAVFITLLILAWKNLKISYRIYCAIIVFVSLSLHTGMGTASPYMGLPRHLLLAFPVFIGLAPRLKEPRSSRWLKVSFFVLLLLTFLHCLHIWVP